VTGLKLLFRSVFETKLDLSAKLIYIYTMNQNAMIHNPHLEGDAFFWEGGPVGVLLLHGYTASTTVEGIALAGTFLPRRHSGPRIRPSEGIAPTLYGTSVC
jgi:hypothetical protein